MKRTTTAVVGAAAALMISAAPASAAEIVGSNLVAFPSSVNNPPRTMTAIDQRVGVPLPITVPADGVIVEIKLKHDALPAGGGMSGFSILSGTHPNFTARTSALLPDFIWSAGPDGTRSFALNPGVQIAAGERLGFRHVSDDVGPVPVVASNMAGGASLSILTGNHVSGELLYPAPQGFELLAQMRIEPDADFDSLGDETQDASIASACLGLQATHFGTPGNDVIVGTAGSDVIVSGGGDDIVRGLGGNDTLCGGTGNDKLKGGAGKDKLYGEADRDKLRGGDGKDYCNGGSGSDSAKRCEIAKKI